MLSILFFLCLVLVSYMVGRSVIRLFKINFSGNLEVFVFSTGVGFGIISYLVFALGLMGLLYWWANLSLMIILFCFSLWEIWKSRAFFQTIRQKLKTRFFTEKGDYFELVLLIILVISCLMTFISSLSPPTDINSAVYNLSIPKLWLQNHSIVYIPYMIASEYPLAIETLYALGMSLTGDISANLISWIMGIMIILSILSFCKRYLTIRIGLLASSALCITSLFSKLSMGSLIDLAVGYYAFLGLYAFLIYLDSNKRNILAVAGIASGLALATKHSGLVPFVILFIWIIAVEIKRRKNHTDWFLRIVIFVLISLLIPTPWYIKSYVNMGNPTVVYFNKIFNGKNVLPKDETNIIMSSRDKQIFDIELKSSSLSPLQLLWRTFFKDMFFWSFGVFFLAAIPLLLVIRGMNKAVKYGLLYSALGFILYSVVTDQPRLIVSVFPCLFISASYAIYWVSEKDKLLFKILQIIVIITLLPNLIPIARASAIRYPAVMGTLTREQYLGKWVDIYDTIQYANQNLSDDVKILTMDPRGYYFDKPYVVGFQITQGFIRFEGIQNAQQMMDLLKQHGITHLLIKNRSTMVMPYINELAPRLKVIYSDHDVYLLAVKS